MVEVALCYGKGINLEYYLKKHIPGAEPFMGDLGCQRLEVRQFQPTPDGKAPAYAVMTSLYFADMATFQTAMQHPAMKAAMDDIKNFYDGMPDFFICERLTTLEAKG